MACSSLQSGTCDIIHLNWSKQKQKLMKNLIMNKVNNFVQTYLYVINAVIAVWHLCLCVHVCQEHWGAICLHVGLKMIHATLKWLERHASEQCWVSIATRHGEHFNLLTCILHECNFIPRFIVRYCYLGPVSFVNDTRVKLQQKLYSYKYDPQKAIIGWCW